MYASGVAIGNAAVDVAEADGASAATDMLEAFRYCSLSLVRPRRPEAAW